MRAIRALISASAQRRVDERGGNLLPGQPVHLVLHQRDQRRDHDRDALEHQRGKLVAQRLAAARRHDDQAVLPGERRRDGLFLAFEKLPKAEVRRQQVLRRILFLHRRKCRGTAGRWQPETGALRVFS